MYKFILNGPPIAQMRHRTHGEIHYNPQDKEKKQCQQILKYKTQRMGLESPLKGPIEVEMTFHTDYPRKSDRKSVNRFLWGCEFNTSKPDDDNMEKFYKDCLSKIVYLDDKQIISTKLKKRYSLQPRTEIMVKEISSKLTEQARKILEMINPDEFMDMMEDLNLLNDSIMINSHKNENQEVAEKVQLEAAMKISEFSDAFGKIFSNISKKYPNAWQEIKAELKVDELDG